MLKWQVQPYFMEKSGKRRLPKTWALTTLLSVLNSAMKPSLDQPSAPRKGFDASCNSRRFKTRWFTVFTWRIGYRLLWADAKRRKPEECQAPGTINTLRSYAFFLNTRTLCESIVGKGWSRIFFAISSDKPRPAGPQWPTLIQLQVQIKRTLESTEFMRILPLLIPDKLYI